MGLSVRAATPRRPNLSRSKQNDPAGLGARRVALGVLRHVLEEGQPLDEALAKAEALEPRDRAFARALVSTTLRRLGQIEAALAPFLRKGPPARKAPAIRHILNLGAAQILFLSVPDHAAVDICVRLAAEDAQALHFTSLVNGVLRSLAREGRGAVEAQDAARLNTPDWLWQRWVGAYGDEGARSVADAALVEPPLDLTPRGDPAALAEALGGLLLPTGTVRLTPEGPVAALPGFAEGQWWVQDAAATLPVRLLGEVAGLRVADLCAAPGGKTAQLAAAGAQVTAVDRSPARLERLAANMARLGLEVQVVAADALEWTPDEPFDAVLLDAPCTATGTVRRHPDIPHLRTERDLRGLVDLQARLLRRAVELVKPGGRLVYATCSLEPEEGEEQVRSLLAQGVPLRRQPIEPAEIGALGQCITGEGDLRTLPFHLPGPTPRMSGLDGFYAARLIREG